MAIKCKMSGAVAHDARNWQRPQIGSDLGIENQANVLSTQPHRLVIAPGIFIVKFPKISQVSRSAAIHRFHSQLWPSGDHRVIARLTVM